MSLSTPFIKRPVATILLMVGIVVFGIAAYRRLPVSDLPTVDYPTITVSANLPGASPETMASAVATPLEKQFSTIAGIDNMTSTSALGSTSITIQFTLDRDIDAAAQDVQAAIAQTLRNLPQGIIPPSYQKVNPADAPIIYFSVTSDLLPLSQLDEYGETVMAQRISMVPGVAQVMVYGSQKYAVRVQLDPTALAYRKIGIDEVANAITSQNVNLPTGILWGANRAYTVEANGQLQDAASFRRMVVAYRNGAPVHLGDVGQVLDDVQSNKVASWYNGKRAIVLAVQRQPGTNTVAVANAVKDLMTQLRAQVPGAVNIQTLYDRSLSIEASVHDVKFTLVLTLCLVVMVIFVFLRNASATLIPSLALPISVIGTFAVMYLLGYSLDNLSLMALTLAVGFVVDDAIVMLENIVRHMEMGKDPMTAAYDGAEEVGFTILSMTLSLTAVFIPILFLGGVVGRLFHEFAVTIAVSILVSGFVSLSLTPMLSSRFLRPHGEEEHGALYNLTERGWQWVIAKYEGSLHFAMRHRRAMLGFSAAILVATAVLFVLVPKGFIPTEDTGQVRVTTEAAQDISYDAMVQHQKELAAIVQQDTNIAGFMSAVGAGGPTSSSNQGRMFISLKPQGKRVSADEFIQELRPKLAHVPGMIVYMQNPPAIQIGGRVAKGLYQFTLQSSDIQSLYPAAQALLDSVQHSPLLQDVSSDLQLGNLQASIQIDRERAASLGVTASQIESALYDAYGSRQVSTIYTPNNEYWVVMELLPQFQGDLSALSLLHIRSNNGTLVPLSAVANVSRATGPLTVNHSGQLPAVTISFNLPPGVALGDAEAAVQAVANRVVPSTIQTAFAGTAQAFQSAQAGLLALLVLAIFVIYVVLGVLYESFIHPLTILSGLPFAAFGALLTLLIFRVDLSVYAFVGIILLVGLVKKNAIMMIDFAIEAERGGRMSPADAIIQACLVRFRPIMMTTMAALLGTLPIALSMGAGAESRRPLGIAVVGGLLFSQFITLYITPVVYTYLDSLSGRMERVLSHEPALAHGGAVGHAPAVALEGLPPGAEPAP
ncbi:MAG TPA: efflux RND transporter permease subunit [Gemmatimonadaceae bacterium]|nr:efflux RND transporter permease subunit [Gemmatimonadaceae bacterium]